ncbi:ATP-dependent Clp protease proteolytic subunit [Lachnospiraceae bacterium]|nr:ATP-dependent Clp protease proteolytic subunit [Lachnospiraceae bacterium]
MSLIPYVVEQTSTGERSHDIFSRLLSDRIVFLGEEVSDSSAGIIIAQMLFLEAQDPEKDIQFYINSPGGSVSAGFAVYDTMQYIKCDVSTICLGMAASFGAFLLAGGTKGKRMALPDAEIMIHQPAIHGDGIQGTAADIKIMSDHIQRSKKRLNRILAENTGKTPEEIAAATDRDNYMSADEALEFGLIDKILTRRI